MSTIGVLGIGLRAKTTTLRKDLQKAKKEVAGWRGALSLDLSRSAAKFATLTGSVASTAGAAFSAAKSSSDALGGSLISLTGSMVAAFGAGGPVGLALASAGAGLGFLVGKNGEISEAVKRARAEYKKLFDEVKKGAAETVKQLERIRKTLREQSVGVFQAGLEGEDASITKRMAKILEAREAANKRLRVLDTERARMLAAIDSLGEPDMLSEARRQKLQDSQAADRARLGGDLRKLASDYAKLQQAQEGLDTLRDRNGIADALVSKVGLDRLQRSRELRELLLQHQVFGVKTERDELDVLEEIQLVHESIAIAKASPNVDERRRIPALEDEIEHLRRVLKLTRDLRAANQGRANQGLRDQIALLSVATNHERARVRVLQERDKLLLAGRDVGLVDTLTKLKLSQIQVPKIVDPFLESLRATLGRGLSDIIQNGIETSFKDAADIARSVMSQLLRSLVNQIVTSGIDSALKSVMAGGLGRGSGLGDVLSSIGGALGGGGSSVPSGIGAAIGGDLGCGPGG